MVIYTANTTKSNNSSSNNDYKGHIQLMDKLFSHALHISAKDQIKKHIRDWLITVLLIYKTMFCLVFCIFVF